MSFLEILDKLDSLVFLGLALPLIYFMYKGHIAIVKEENKVLKEQNENLKLFRVSEVTEDFRALKEHFQELKKQTRGKDAVIDKSSQQLIYLLDFLMDIASSSVAFTGHSIPRRLAQMLVRIEGPVGDFWRKQYTKQEWLDVDGDMANHPLWGD